MAKPPRTDEVREPIATLVHAFLTSATSEFASLVATRDASWSVRVEHATRAGIVPVAPEDIAGFFWITGAFQTARISGEITFGDREFLINTVLGPTSGAARYGLWEWADALGRPELVPRVTDFVLTSDRLERIVAGMAHATIHLRDDIARSDPSVVERMERARDEEQAAYQRRSARDDHRRASAAAAKAFAARDFDRVVKLLAPFDAVLTPAERKRLVYARTHANA
jgi:hypothetical protein